MTPFQQAVPDTTQAAAGASTAYDSIWADPNVPAQSLNALDAFLMGQGKIYTVLAVVLIIWLGLALYIYQTDRKLRRLERTLEQRIAPEND